MKDVMVIGPFKRGEWRSIKAKLEKVEPYSIAVRVRSIRPIYEVGLCDVVDLRQYAAYSADDGIPDEVWAAFAKGHPVRLLKLGASNGVAREESVMDSSLKVDQSKQSTDLPEFVVLPDAVQLTGSRIIVGEGEDLDVVVRWFSEDLTDLFESKYGKDIHILYVPEGSTWTHESVAHLFFSPVEKGDLCVPLAGTEKLVVLPLSIGLMSGVELKFRRLGFDVVLESEIGERVQAEDLGVIGYLCLRFHDPIRHELPEQEFYERIFRRQVRDSTQSPCIHADTFKPQRAFSDLDSAWRFISKRLDGTVLLQPKYDGLHMIVVKNGDDIQILTEDTRRDRVPVLPGLVKRLKERYPKRSFVLQTELLAFRGSAPVPRWELSRVVHQKEPIEEWRMYFKVWDVSCLDGESLRDLPYVERLQRIEELRSKVLHVPPTVKVVSRESFVRQAIRLASKKASEGIIVRVPEAQWGEGIYKWRKYKAVNAMVIGFMRKARPMKPEERPQRDLEGDEALRLYRRLSGDSDIYILRCAVKLDGKLVPVLAKHKLTPGDLEIHWDAERGQWKGLEDQRLWTMLKGWPHRKAGELAYGSTYVVKMPQPPKLGSIITVRVQLVRVLEVDGQRIVTWIFPTPTEDQPELTEPDDVGGR